MPMNMMMLSRMTLGMILSIITFSMTFFLMTLGTIKFRGAVLIRMTNDPQQNDHQHNCVHPNEILFNDAQFNDT